MIDASGRNLSFLFPQEGLYLASTGPAISRDQGNTWNWLGEEACHFTGQDGFEYAFSEEENEVWFCVALPYLLADWTRYLQSLDRPHSTSFLCKGRNEREIPMLHLQGQDSAPLVVITARHHACESSPGFLMEGLVDAWESPAGLSLIPFVDLEGCECGDQGKNRNGRDHNRDYLPDAIYPETRAIMKWLQGETRRFLALDLHCPHIRGDCNDTLYVVGGPDPEQARRQEVFSTFMERHA